MPAALMENLAVFIVVAKFCYINVCFPLYPA